MPLPKKLCANCRTPFTPIRKTSRYCSRPCMWANNGGHNRKPETWWINAKGYTEGKVWVDEHTQIRVKKHRWLMENHLGRKLRADEDVHHKDGDKQNNVIENLEVISHGDHSTHHNLKRTYKSGYKLKLTTEQRAERSAAMKAMRARQAKGATSP